MSIQSTHQPPSFPYAGKKRYVLFPIQYSKIWEMYQKQVDCFWRPEEIDLSSDMVDWMKLSEDEKYFISMILAFFASSDGIVMENLACRFMTEIDIPEVRSFYGFQIAMENIHSHTYSLLIDTYINDEEKKHMLFNSIDYFPCIQEKAEWAQTWIGDKESSLETRLVAFACVEGIFFSGAFCSIYWLKKRGLMQGLTFSNELISRDESMHCDFAILMYNHMQTKLSADQFNKIVVDAVNIETKFICDALPCRLIGMNSTLMTQYIKYVADRLSLQFGYNKIYNVTNPFDFMELISLDGKTNFFEQKVSEYGMVSSSVDGMFDISEDF